MLFTYNSAENRPVNTCFLNEIPQVGIINWPAFSKQEFKDAIAKCSLSSALGPDHISWKYLKTLFSNDLCLKKIVNVADTCINLEYWPSHFKATNTVIIPKPNKESYSTPNSSAPLSYSTLLASSLRKLLAIDSNSTW